MAVQSPAKEFLLAEYTDRRNDILQRIQRIEEQIRYGLLATAGLWTWLLVNTKTTWFPVAAWIPFVVIAYFFVAWLLQHYAIKATANYVKEIEKQFDLPTGTGWETNLDKYRVGWLVWITNGFWAVLLLLNLMAALLVPVWQMDPAAKGP